MQESMCKANKLGWWAVGAPFQAIDMCPAAGSMIHLNDCLSYKTGLSSSCLNRGKTSSQV